MPPGVCTSFDPPEGDEGEIKGGNRLGNSDSGQQNGDFDMSASVYRHTYNQNLSQFGTQFQGPPVRNFPKLNGSKTTRAIRLRPRQTLCSKCKASCLDSDKGPIPISQSIRSQNVQKNVSVQQRDPNKSLITRNDAKKKRSFEADEPDCIEPPKPTKLIKLEQFDKTAALTKTSPFIKISIGEGTVMNIPPRIHEDNGTEELSSEEKTDGENITTVVSNDDDDDDENCEDENLTANKKHKKSLKKSKEKDKVCSNTTETQIKDDTLTYNRKKHKKRHKREKESPVDESSTLIITENIDVDDNDDDNEKNENSDGQHVVCQRPRLLYTWRQNKGLSPRHDSPSNRDDGFRVYKTFSPQRDSHSSSSEPNIEITSITSEERDLKSTCVQNNGRKEYRLRSRSKSLDSNPSYEITSDSAYISYEDPKSISDRSEGCSTGSDSDSDSSDYADGPPGDEDVEAFRPLMMKIQTNSVSKCVTPDGRKISIGDIVWGKIQGFPWWPSRVLSIAISKRDNDVVLRQVAHVSWFGSSTMSNIQCSDLFPFLEDFKVRYKRKKRGPYKVAIKQATIAAQGVSNAHEVDLSDFDL